MSPDSQSALTPRAIVRAALHQPTSRGGARAQRAHGRSPAEARPGSRPRSAERSEGSLDTARGGARARPRRGDQLDERRARPGPHDHRGRRSSRRPSGRRPRASPREVDPPRVQRPAIDAVRAGPVPGSLACLDCRRQAAPRLSLIRDLPSLVHRFLLGTDEALGRLSRRHPGVADGSRRSYLHVVVLVDPYVRPVALPRVLVVQRTEGWPALRNAFTPADIASARARRRSCSAR